MINNIYRRTNPNIYIEYVCNLWKFVYLYVKQIWTNVTWTPLYAVCLGYASLESHFLFSSLSLNYHLFPGSTLEIISQIAGQVSIFFLRISNIQTMENGKEMLIWDLISLFKSAEGKILPKKTITEPWQTHYGSFFQIEGKLNFVCNSWSFFRQLFDYIVFIKYCSE